MKNVTQSSFDYLVCPSDCSNQPGEQKAEGNV